MKAEARVEGALCAEGEFMSSLVRTGRETPDGHPHDRDRRPAASVHPTAEIGPYAIVGARVTIGARTTVGAHAVIEGRRRSERITRRPRWPLSEAPRKTSSTKASQRPW